MAKITAEAYSEFVTGEWNPPNFGSKVLQEAMYTAMCMAGEAGEVCDSMKKVLKGTQTTHDLLLECGDTLYYLTRLINHCGYKLEDVMEMNVEKLTKRKKNAVHSN